MLQVKVGKMRSSKDESREGEYLNTLNGCCARNNRVAAAIGCN